MGNKHRPEKQRAKAIAKRENLADRKARKKERADKRDEVSLTAMEKLVSAGKTSNRAHLERLASGNSFLVPNHPLNVYQQLLNPSAGIGIPSNDTHTARAKKLLFAIVEKAPRLLYDDLTLNAVRNLSQLEWVRPLGDWSPKGKASETLARSLLGHLLAVYRLTPFLLRAGWHGGYVGLECTDFVARVGKGTSAHKLMNGRFLPFTMTKAMTHEFMATRGRFSFVEGIRRAQLECLRSGAGVLGGSLKDPWLSVPYGVGYHREDYLLTILQWIANQNMLEPGSLSPLGDYIDHMAAEGAFPMAGRSAAVMYRNMEDWHQALTKKREAGKLEAYTPSGISAAEWTNRRRVNGNHVEEKISVVELLSNKDLYREGKALRHCVFSYGYRVQAGRVAIFSLRRGSDFETDERLLTLEVDIAQRKVVQIRGWRNRHATTQEMKWVRQWADKSRVRA
jgi:hypothetical protein